MPWSWLSKPKRGRVQQPQGARLCSLSQPWATPKMGPTPEMAPMNIAIKCYMDKTPRAQGRGFMPLRKLR